MAAESQQQEELAPGLLQELAVVSAMARGMTARASAGASPRAVAAQVMKVVEGTLAASTPHSCSLALTSWQAYVWLGAGAGAVKGAGRVATGTAGLMGELVANGVGGGGEGGDGD